MLYFTYKFASIPPSLLEIEFLPNVAVVLQILLDLLSQPLATALPGPSAGQWALCFPPQAAPWQSSLPGPWLAATCWEVEGPSSGTSSFFYVRPSPDELVYGFRYLYPDFCLIYIPAFGLQICSANCLCDSSVLIVISKLIGPN